MTTTAIDPAALAYDERGLLPVVVQDVLSGAVLRPPLSDPHVMNYWVRRAAIRAPDDGRTDWFACGACRATRVLAGIRRTNR